MGFFEWHGKLVRSVSENQLSLALLGRTLVVFSLGSLYSLGLVQYGYFILLAAVFILVLYVNGLFVAWQQNRKVEYKTHLFGTLGSLLPLFFFGAQSPQVPYKLVILTVGIVCVLPAAVTLLKKKFDD